MDYVRWGTRARRLQPLRTPHSLILRGYPSEKVGVKQGDVEFNRIRIKDVEHLRNLVADTKPGTTVELKVLRQGEEKPITLRVKLTERPIEIARGGELPSEEIEDVLGMRLQNLTPDVARELGYEGERGVLVVEVDPEGPAAKAKVQIQPRDLIVAVIRRGKRIDIADLADLREALLGHPKGKPIVFLIKRGKNPLYVAITPEED